MLGAADFCFCLTFCLTFFGLVVDVLCALEWLALALLRVWRGAGGGLVMRGD